MEQCPICGRWLKFNMQYFCGCPLIFYTCICGYDSREYDNTVWTNSTNPINLNLSN